MNLVGIEQGGDTIIKLIDFDASAKLGEACHRKFSSSFAPPMLASELLEYERETGHKPTDATAPTSWADWATQRGRLKASVAKDCWAAGILAFKLCVEDGASMFLSTEADNIVKHTDLQTLAWGWEQRKLEEIERVVWPDAADLILKCLQTDEDRRPQSFEALMQHPFLAEEGQQGVLYFPESVDVRAQQLHVAIQAGDCLALQALFTAGGVHISLVIDGSDMTPLICAAFGGDIGIVKILLEEIDDDWPADEKARILDCRTKLNYTAFMMASDCGHTHIAELLEAKGCTIGLRNTANKTGMDLAAAAAREAEQQVITPFNHGHNLHLGCESPEQ